MKVLLKADRVNATNQFWGDFLTDLELFALQVHAINILHCAQRESRIFSILEVYFESK